MKNINCSYSDCGSRRIHWERPDEMRGQQRIEVDDNHIGPMYCSISCACMDGYMSVRLESKEQQEIRREKYNEKKRLENSLDRL